MKKTNKRKNTRKQYVGAAIVCAVSFIVLTGIYRYEWSTKKQGDQIIDLSSIETDSKNTQAESFSSEKDKNEEIFGWDNVMDATDEAPREEINALGYEDETGSLLYSEENKEETKSSENNGQASKKKEQITSVEQLKAKEESALKEDEAGNEVTADEGVSEGETLEVAEAIAEPISLTFAQGDILSWPVYGNVIMNYSMDKSIYFATLDQYKYNPAIVIQAKEDTPVVAAKRGQVLNIEEEAQTGTTLVMDLGNDYKATYGQLKNPTVTPGQVVEAGEVIGYVNAPTKYYALEGSNLYFKLQHEQKPVNPMAYLE